MNNEFSKYCDAKILKLKVSKYLLKYLKKNYRDKNFFISTGTPQKYIKINKKIKIEKFFKSIHGSPSNKVDHINKILSNIKIDQKRYLLEIVELITMLHKMWDNISTKLNSESKNLRFPKKY